MTKTDQRSSTHSTVYGEPHMYVGWPANHGAWQWGDEFLVGFMRGPFYENGAMHQIGLPIDFQFQRATQANLSFTGTRNAVGH